MHVSNLCSYKGVLGVANLKKEPDNKDLKASHANHHQALNNTEVEDPPLRTPDRAEIPVLSRSEILLVTCNRRELA